MQKLKIPQATMQRGRFGVVDVKGLRPDLSNQEQARFFSENGIKMKGIFFTSKQGTTSDIRIEISGEAKFLVGFRLVMGNNSGQIAFPDPRVNFSININNEQVIQNAFANLHDSTNNFRGEFTPLPRMLSGKDDIKLSWTDVQAQAVGIEFWYI